MMTRRSILQLPLAAAFAPSMSDTFRMLHIDAHFARVPNPYADFDADRAAAIVADAGFQMVSIFAVCNRGLSYYPTKVGTMHPGLQRDFTGEFSKALKKRGLRVLAYVSVRDCRPNLPQLEEILDRYGVDGFFFDSVLKCSDEDNRRFADSVKPGLTYFMNHLWVTTNPVNPPKSLKTLCWEPVPPYRGVVTEDFSIQARYLPTLPGIENWCCMSTRGKGWGDRSIRSLEAYLQETAVVMAAGGRVYWGDVSHPSGNPDPDLYKIWGEMNKRVAALEPYVRNVKPVKGIAVRIPSAGMAATHRALVEQHVQFSILNPETMASTLSEYKAVILPEEGGLTPAETDAVRRFGGMRISDPGDFPVEKREIEVKNAPFHVEITLNRRQNDLFLHLVNRHHDYTRVEGIQVRLRTGRSPRMVREVPTRQTIRFDYRDGQTSFEALPLHIHSAYQIEG